MLIAKTALGALLTAAFFAVTGPSILMQDSGPGNPDDVAQLLPADTLAFAEVVKAPRLFHDWKEYIGSVTTPAGKEEACKVIEEWFKKAIEIVPEKLLKDLEKGLPSIQRIAVAIPGMADPDFPWIFIATSSDAELFKKIVDEDLKVFSGGEKIHQGMKALVINKMGDLKWSDPLYVAALGPRLLLTTHWPSMAAAMDRAAGKKATGDLRQNPLYARLSTKASEDPVLRAFGLFPWDQIGAGPRLGAYRNERSSRYRMDQVDAVFEFRKLVGMTLEATIRPGQVTSRLQVHIDPPCRIYDAIRQPAGPKDLLASLPKGTAIAAHVNLKGGKEIWKSVEDMVRRFEAIQRKIGEHEKDEGMLEELDRESERHIGCTFRQIAEAVGNECLLALVDDPAIVSPDSIPMGFLLLVRIPEPAKAKAILDKVVERVRNYTVKKDGEATYYLPPEGGEFAPAFGLKGTVAALGFKPDLLKEAFAAKAETSGFVKNLPKEAESASGLIGLRVEGILSFLKRFGPPDWPDALKHLRPDLWSTSLIFTEKDRLEIRATDAGHSLGLQAGLMAVPVVFMAFVGSLAAMPVFPAEAVTPAEARPEPPALAADELAKRVSEQVEKLRSEEAATRDQASAALRALGKQAIPLLVAAVRKEGDAEARNRLVSLLLDHKAYDAFPELVERKADAFFEELRTALGQRNPDQWGGHYVQWEMSDQNFTAWSLEPYYVNDSILKGLKNGDLPAIPGGLKRFAERLQKSDLAPPLRQQLAAVLAFNESAAAVEPILAMLGGTADAPTKAYLTIALGWSKDARAVQAVAKALEGSDPFIRRAGFIAAERTQDPSTVTALLARLEDKELETRWNATFTLRALTGGKISLNAFVPDDEFTAARKAALKWWEENKANFRIK
jgi:HEAT repeat protein